MSSSAVRRAIPLGIIDTQSRYLAVSYSLLVPLHHPHEPDTQCTPEDVRRSVQESLDKLGFIPDLFLLHNPHLVAKQEGKNIEDMYALVEDLVLDGTLKGCSLGISNFRQVTLVSLTRSEADRSDLKTSRP